MRSIVSVLLVFISLNVFGKGSELPIEISSLEVGRIFDEQFLLDKKLLPDFIDREEKVGKCVEDYIKKQSRSYSKIVQNNLYDLIHNFDRITSKIYGKKQPADEIPYEEKVEALAKVQCEAYYAVNALK
jgi:hypothetical protein